ncbi:MAG: hypothetical protein IT382_21010 [Deltaproteobacteria bacterium]|nr:hypothetical protein [Deltaproteobacteria bacterium]
MRATLAQPDSAPPIKDEAALRAAAERALASDTGADDALTALAAVNWGAARSAVLHATAVPHPGVERTLVAFSSREALHAWMRAHGLPISTPTAVDMREIVYGGAGCFDVTVVQPENPPQGGPAFLALALAAGFVDVHYTQTEENLEPACNALKKGGAPDDPTRAAGRAVALRAVAVRGRSVTAQAEAPTVFHNCYGDVEQLDLQPVLALVNDLLRARRSPLRYVPLQAHEETAAVLLVRGDGIEAARERGLW